LLLAGIRKWNLLFFVFPFVSEIEIEEGRLILAKKTARMMAIV
jgi:hypothetical protein